MRLREERFRILTENLNTGVALIDGNGQFVAVNPIFLKMFGLPADSSILNVNSRDWSAWQVYGENGRTLLDVDDHPIREAVAKEQPIKDRVVGVVNPGSKDIAWMLINAQPLMGPDGKIQQIIATYHDVTELKHAEQLKDEFIGMVSHELKTPITVIMGALITAIDPRVPRELSRELIDDAIAHSEILANIVDNLLELSRQQSGRLVIKTELVDIRQVIRDVIKKLTWKSSSHHIRYEEPVNVPALMADPFRIERILYNLVDNAIKYSPDGGDVTITAREDGNNLRVGVNDNGPGISPENQGKLFQSFERLGASVPGSIQGIGLGLKVCKILVEAHNGKIWVESEPGKGSAFYFVLPLK